MFDWTILQHLVCLLQSIENDADPLALVVYLLEHVGRESLLFYYIWYFKLILDCYSIVILIGLIYITFYVLLWIFVRRNTENLIHNPLIIALTIRIIFNTLLRCKGWRASPLILNWLRLSLQSKFLLILFLRFRRVLEHSSPSLLRRQRCWRKHIYFIFHCVGNINIKLFD